MLAGLLALSLIAVSAAVAAPLAYISNFGSGTVSVIDAGPTARCVGAGQTPPCVVATVPVGSTPGDPATFPGGVAVNPAGTLAYVANQGDGTVSVISTADNTLAGPAISVGVQPWGVAVSADNSKVYVGLGDMSVAVIDVNNGNKVTAIRNVGGMLNGIVVSGSRVYVSDAGVGQVVVIDANAGVVSTRVPVGSSFNAIPMGIVANSAGTRVYVVDLFQDSVSLKNTLEVSTIDTTSNPPAVIGTMAIDPATSAVPGGVALSPDESRLYVTNDSLDQVTIVPLLGGTPVSVTVGRGPVGVATDPTGRVYVANVNAGTVSVFDPAVNAPPKTIAVGSTPFVFGAFVTAGPQFALVLNTIGSGAIAAQPSSATGKYDGGTVVSLTATPSPGFLFTGWSNACSGITNPCSVTMDAAKSVTATFTAQFSLALNTVGSGTIAAQPSSASGTYAAGTPVALTATPAAGFQFTSWSGACSGSTNPCNVTMNAAMSVTATFTTTTPPPPPPTACDDKISDLQKKVARYKHHWWYDNPLREALRMYSASLLELGKAKAKVGGNDKRYVRGQKEFKEGKDAVCAGRYWHADVEFWEAYLIAKDILKQHRR